MTDHTPDFNDVALARYLSGECDPAEDAAIRRWIEADPERRQRVEALRALWREAERPAAAWDTDAMWGEVSAGMDRPVERPPLQVLPPQDSTAHAGHHQWFARRRSSWAAVAASVLLASGGAAWLATHQLKPRTQPIPMREVTTARGQRAELHMGDGTRVLLGADSKLRFPATIGATRDVYLEGEAYFDVVHDPRRPFAVHTARAVARDIGTRFGVRAYAGGPATEVVVAQGSVALRAATPGAAGAAADSLVLAQADLGRLEPDGALTVRHRVNVDSYLAWMEGRLEFAGTPLREALPQLSRWYDVDLRLGDPSLAGSRLTASLQVESLGEALELLSAALDARVERQGRTVVLYPKHPTRTH